MDYLTPGNVLIEKISLGEHFYRWVHVHFWCLSTHSLRDERCISEELKSKGSRYSRLGRRDSEIRRRTVAGTPNPSDWERDF